jgi:hypothetical protein
VFEGREENNQIERATRKILVQVGCVSAQEFRTLSIDPRALLSRQKIVFVDIYSDYIAALLYESNCRGAGSATDFEHSAVRKRPGGGKPRNNTLPIDVRPAFDMIGFWPSGLARYSSGVAAK